jgi:hypothetical protein
MLELRWYTLNQYLYLTSINSSIFYCPYISKYGYYKGLVCGKLATVMCINNSCINFLCDECIKAYRVT